MRSIAPKLSSPKYGRTLLCIFLHRIVVLGDRNNTEAELCASRSRIRSRALGVPIASKTSPAGEN
ncbi:hypothetical protein [Microcoleus sp. CAWBG58]|uniref:hypothetical protein n=1 Tax=Microcoleus sp. CAWBG58 TaxID=2841651 RepID=UPI0025CCAA01|nr:hypothetical protein [Microcoleus sp. CAWBG58]